MDYPDIDQILLRHGLGQEPAFDKVGIAIRPIPDMNGCPLGLYYPDSALIIIPPDGQESVLLHELGHRYGHYYHNNISEPFAEDYRHRYQKGDALMYSGRDFGRLPKFDALFQEGERGVLALAFSVGLSQDDLMGIEQQFSWYSRGEPLPKITYSEDGLPTVTVHFQKGVEWLVIAGAVMAGTIVLSASAVAYAVYKISKDMPWLPAVLGVGFLSFLGLRALSRRTLEGKE